MTTTTTTTTTKARATKAQAPARKGPATKAQATAATKAPAPFVSTKDATAFVVKHSDNVRGAAIAARCGALVYLLTHGAILEMVVADKRPDAWKDLRGAVAKACGDDEAGRWAADVRRLAALTLGANPVAIKHDHGNKAGPDVDAMHKARVALLAKLTKPVANPDKPTEAPKDVTFAGAVARLCASFEADYGNPHGMRQAFKAKYGPAQHVAEGAGATTTAEAGEGEGEGQTTAEAPAPVSYRVQVANMATALVEMVNHGAAEAKDGPKAADLFAIARAILRLGNEGLARRIVAEATTTAEAQAAPSKAAEAQAKANAAQDKAQAQATAEAATKAEAKAQAKAARMAKATGTAPKAPAEAPAPKAPAPKAEALPVSAERQAEIDARQAADVAKAQAKAKAEAEAKAFAKAKAILARKAA